MPMVEQKIDQLLDVMKRLRDPDHGCPWDQEQDFLSILPYTIEEAYEVADAIEQGDMGLLREELGDLLLQVVFHARMAEEQGAFDFADVVEGITTKLIRRHPHVFGSAQTVSVEEQRIVWEELKADERGRQPVLAGVARALPALSRAAKLGRRASAVGFDWPDRSGVMDKIREELREVETAASDTDLAEEVGDLLFAVTSLARHLGVDPEEALRQANHKFERRFAHVEQRVMEDGGAWPETDAALLDGYWEEAKTSD